MRKMLHAATRCWAEKEAVVGRHIPTSPAEKQEMENWYLCSAGPFFPWRVQIAAVKNLTSLPHLVTGTLCYERTRVMANIPGLGPVAWAGPFWDEI